MPITRFDHYTIRTEDYEASWHFYEQVLGLQVQRREGAPMPGFIVSAGDTEVVHAFQAAPNIDEALKRMTPNKIAPVTWSTWRLQHVEFWATGLDEMKARWEAAGVPITEHTWPDKHQVGLRDPDDIVININFPLSEISQ